MAVDPAWIQAGSSVLGGMLGRTNTSSAGNTEYLDFNTDGYTVATSGSKAEGGIQSQWPWYVWVIAGVVVIKILKRKKA